MSRKTTHSRRRRTTTTGRLSAFFKRPQVQLGVIGLAALVVVAIILINNGRQPAQATPVVPDTSLPAEISIEQAYQKYQQAGVFFLDVREPDEWIGGHIPNTTLIPRSELADRLGDLPRDQEIVIVCRTGNRSLEARNFLLQNGFTTVTSVAGGVRAWGMAGYPFEGAIP